MRRAGPAAILLALAGCSREESTVVGDARRELRPGVGLGDILLGARLSELPADLGAPEQTIVNQRLGFVRYPGGLELVITSPDAFEAAPGSRVVALGISSADGYRGVPLPGQSRAEIERALGAAADEIDAVAYYGVGASVTYAEGTARKVVVIAPYENRATPPEMESAP